MTTNVHGGLRNGDTNQRRACVVGGCPVGRSVANALAASGVPVQLLDTDRASGVDGGVTVAESGRFDGRALRDAGVDEGTTLVAVHPDDATNLLLAQNARVERGVDLAIARVNDPRRVDAFEDAGITAVDASAVLGRTILERW